MKCPAISRWRNTVLTTQGGPLAMPFYALPFYALATLPLIKACKVDKLSGEVWYAGDATGCGTLDALCSWWDRLTTLWT